jgi:hypothetical protein
MATELQQANLLTDATDRAYTMLSAALGETLRLVSPDTYASDIMAALRDVVSVYHPDHVTEFDAIIDALQELRGQLGENNDESGGSTSIS